MTHQYSLTTFLRQVRGSMLNQCLRRQGIHHVVLDESVSRKTPVIDAICCLEPLTPDQYRDMNAEFEQISLLASTTGAQAIMAAAQQRGHDDAEFADDAGNVHELACATYLNHPDVFRLASLFHDMDRVAAGRWHRRLAGAGLTPAIDADAIARFEASLRKGCGRNDRLYHVEHYTRPDPIRHCFFVTVSGPGASVPKRGEPKLYQVHPRPARKPAFVAALVYRPEEGLLEVLSHDDWTLRADLVRWFSASILGLAKLPPVASPEPIDLSALLSPDLELSTDPDDGIRYVQLREVALTPSCGPAMIAFAARDGRRAKKFTFRLSRSGHTTLKDTPHDRIARKCMQLWGIAVGERDQVPRVPDAETA